MNKSGRDLLTEQQIEVLEQLAAGKSNSEIAQTLSVPLDAVKLAVREIMAKLDVTSPEAAVEAARPGRFTRVLGTVPSRLWAGIAVVALAGTAALGILYVTARQSGPGEGTEDLRVLIGHSLSPEPGIRVIDLPSEREQKFLEELGELFFVIWSPTGDHLWTLFEPDEDEPGPSVQRVVLMSYPEGNYAVLEFESEEGPSAPHWSPDGTRVAFVTDRLRMYTSDGELLAERSAEVLGVELRAGEGFGGPHWSADSQMFMVRPAFPTRLVDRDGGLLERVTVENLGAEGIANGQMQWWPGEATVLFALGWPNSDPPERIIVRLEVQEDGVLATTLDEFPEEVLDSFNPPTPPPELLEDIELRAPAGRTALFDVPIGHWGWGVSFEEVDRDRGAEPSTLTVLRIGDISYQYESPNGLGRVTVPNTVLVLGGAPPPERTIPASDTEGCPVFEDFCDVASHQLAMLLAGDVDALMDFSLPVQYRCRQRGLPGGRATFPEGDVCAGSTSGVGRFRLPVDYGDGDQQYATLYEFRVFLSSIATRMAAARDDVADEFGNGAPRIVSVTVGPFSAEQVAEAAASPRYANLSWLEDSGGGVERIVLGLELGRTGISAAIVRTDDTGRQFALTGGTIPQADGTEERHLLWP